MEEKILAILTEMQQDMRDMKTDTNNIKTTQQEHTQLLGALEHPKEVMRAEQDNMNIRLIKIEGSTKRIEQEVAMLKRDTRDIEKRTAKNWSDVVEIKERIGL